MPCVTNLEPDSFNLDTLLSKHSDCYRVVTSIKNTKTLKLSYSKNLTVSSSQVIPHTHTTELSMQMKIDFNLTIYNNMPKVERSPFQPSMQSKNIPCIIFSNGKHSLDPNALILKNQNYGFPAHSQCLYKLKLKLAQPHTPLNKEQKNIFYFTKFLLLNKEQKKQLYQMILNKLPKRDISKKEKGKENINQAHQPSKQQPKNKTDSTNNNSNNSQNLLDWFANFPITSEMKQQYKLSTKLAQKLFFSMKTYLNEFTPGQPIKTNDQPKQNPKKEP
ncbi:hypothetical protein C2G38_2213188 [Gigaspora rosea]|uniref:Uncharacterized protein n=1 Tax=Gigaspora rosea TaxID=44941 RepID=A0A397UGD4_9GLOM|nr:hypothetical protein C2G38_2213188 [Gigaspora rosea]